MFEYQEDSESDRKSFEEAIGLGATPRADPPPPIESTSPGLFGMTATQRLIVALLLLMAVCGLGLMCGLITGVFNL
jgi:hypothetical protein